MSNDDKTKDKDSSVEIFINTAPFDVPKGDITHADVVRLGHGVTGEESQGYSVTYERGPEGHPEGVLPYGGKIKAHKGTRFDVFPTGRS